MSQFTQLLRNIKEDWMCREPTPIKCIVLYITQYKNRKIEYAYCAVFFSANKSNVNRAGISS